MTFWRVGLLLMLTVALSPVVGHQTHDIHEEEHRNITLTCLFPVGTDMPPDSLQIGLKKEKTLRNIYLYDSRLEAEPYTDEFYKGRLHCDPSFIRNEPIKCLLTDLRFNDAGTYRFVVVADGKRNSETFNLVVTASRDETPEEISQPGIRGRFGLCVALGMFLGMFVAALVVRYVMSSRKKSRLTNDKLLEKKNGSIV
ncbi:uncharacterized protein LOC121639800 isoform X6 [Melanotaenia boesemani]|uniref:uncharacterized protein LOC121639800 isoform X6 n=1 Tax=Melanotaenia boesemani TaxID=1250792 RepID=UPI001C04482D|nr:uncharacterized protein LOC121639800 isoform X6 [Melanotaenia boesemani]